MESKRIFNQAKMNRDIDDRLLPEGSYRYANNVNIGESEGGDIGAVENLKGNHVVGEDVIGGTTIGVVRDPNADRVYFFNKGVEFDTIYEYDESLGTVVPILKDSVDRDLVKPTCTPTFTTFINDPDSDPSERTEPSFSYKEAVEGCIVQFNPNGNGQQATNYNPNATYQDTTTCNYPAPPPPPGDTFTFADTGTVCAGSIPQAGSTDVLADGLITATVGTIQSITPNTVAANATMSVVEHTFQVNVTGTIPTGEGFDQEGTSFDFTEPVTCGQLGTVIPDTFTFGFSTAPSTLAGTTSSGQEAGEETTEGIPFNVGALSLTSMLAIDDNPTTPMQWGTPPTASISNNPAGVGLSAVSPTQADIDADGGTSITTAAMVTLTGTYTPTKPEDVLVTWSNGTLVPVPMEPSAPAVNYNATNYQSNSGSGGISNQFIRSGTAASVHAELIQLNEFGLITFGGTLNVEFTATPLVSSGGNVDQTIQLNSFILPGDAIHNIQYQWTVDAAIDTTWNIIINSVEITNSLGDVTGTTGLITGSPSPGLVRSGSGGGTP